MTKKEVFIKEIETLINIALEETSFEGLSQEANEYFEELKKTKTSTSITENGAKILLYMKENLEKYNNSFKAKDVGEGLFVSSRSISGSMKKLVTDGFVEKTNSEPICYSITESGINIISKNEEKQE